MRTTLLGAFALLLSLVLAGSRTAGRQSPGDGRFDLLIVNGRVMDGSGNPWFRADIGIANGRIAALGQLDRTRVARVIDARDRYVTPGFIDAGFSPPRDSPRGGSSVYQSSGIDCSPHGLKSVTHGIPILFFKSCPEFLVRATAPSLRGGVPLSSEFFRNVMPRFRFACPAALR